MSLPLWGSLYDAVALGMYTYARAAHRVRVVAPADERIVKGTLYLAAHRAETDVPVICGSYYFAARVWGQRNPRLHFAARDDLFQPGFFAGFPPNLPRRLRRALYPVAIGRYLPHVRVHPISSAVTMKLGQALALVEPELELDLALSAPVYEAVLARARELDATEPTCVAHLLKGDYADLLWLNVEARDLPAEAFDRAWSSRAAAAKDDLRAIIDLVRDGEALLLFPEGQPSPDGDLGPLRRGLGAVIRRGRPERLSAFGLAYDPLTTGRDTVVLGVLESVDPPTGAGEPDVLPYLSRAIALTSGQVVSATLLEAVRAGATNVSPAALDAALVDAQDEALAARRLVDPVLGDKGSRRRLLEDALRAVERRGGVKLAGSRSVRLVDHALRADPVVARLATEHGAVKRELQRDDSSVGVPTNV
ncbi:MAG: hypothetical protein ACR2OD_12975 [Gaiellaceae bacterium]